ncbi:PD-(D/E)XK nuclease family protein [Nonomuraea sp. NPDC049141]|uniref:PD-(D/E)XK nuclease family protein n=1 Tax=Nonomuraea sp. NPDC049141 TaxID=3155500 RepID=UPI0033DA66AF
MDDDGEQWAMAAAYVAAKYRGGIPATLVRVVEIGLVDGSISVLTETAPQQAIESFETTGIDRARVLMNSYDATPCHSCGDCKAAGSCQELIPVNGMLGQSERGYKSRSVSPRELEQYSHCPAQWLLDSELHLPKDQDDGEGIMRGKAVHRWLAVAHARSIPCTVADLHEPGSDNIGLAAGVLSSEEYAAAYPFLCHHIDNCPLANDGSTALIVDQNIYGFDHLADVTVVSKPDLIYRIGDTLVAREVKTTARIDLVEKNAAYDRYFQVPFMLTMLLAGLAERFNAQNSKVELEILTPDNSYNWTWGSGDPIISAVAAGDVRRAASEWHRDNVWETRPGPQCSWCPVAQWCPDRDVWKETPKAEGNHAGREDPASEHAPF